MYLIYIFETLHNLLIYIELNLNCFHLIANSKIVVVCINFPFTFTKKNAI